MGITRVVTKELIAIDVCTLGVITYVLATFIDIHAQTDTVNSLPLS